MDMNVSYHNITVADIEFMAWSARLRTIVVLLMCSLCLVNVITNCCILVACRWIRGLLSPTLILTMSMMMSDLWAFLIMCAGLVVQNLHHWGLYSFQSACIPLAMELIRLGGMSTAVLHLMIVSVNHYLNIVAPFHYKSLVRRSEAFLCASLLWITPLVGLFVHSLSDVTFGFRHPKCNVAEYSKFRFRIVFFSIYSVCFVAMLFIYVHIGVILTRMQAQFSGKSAQLQKKKKTINTAILIVITFFFGWIPPSAIYAIFCPDCAIVLTGTQNDSLRLKYSVTIISIVGNFLILLKTFINPIIYGLRIPEIKEALIAMKFLPGRFAPTRNSSLVKKKSHRAETLPLNTTAARQG